jgi:hypothetical protein
MAALMPIGAGNDNRGPKESFLFPLSHHSKAQVDGILAPVLLVPGGV